MATVVNKNGFASVLDKPTSPQSVFSTSGIAITPSDSTILDPMPREIYVGGAGTVVLENSQLQQLTFECPAGVYIKQRARRVMAASDATLLVGIV